MGSVFLAQQTEPVKRIVAVKVIKAGMDSKAVLVRFEAERQALAMMDHPNIAKVLDAGTTDGGRPFFVMELVKGQPITKFCDERKLTPRQRLELFVPVCQAIQHAHQKGIIHRDIKPSQRAGGAVRRPAGAEGDRLRRGQGHRADADRQDADDRLRGGGRHAGVHVAGTGQPEQPGHRHPQRRVFARRAAVRTADRHARRWTRNPSGKAALLEILRIVREVEAPKPSARLSSSDTLPSVAANRGTEPAKLSKLLKGELDWLVLKALEKDRSRRYDTANALSRDIQRYLADEMVEARPPSAATG